MSPPASDDLAPAGQETHRFFLAPLRHTKTLYLIRHGEGYHNLFGEKDHEAYKSEQFFDAHLDPKGWLQCAALRAHLERATTHDGAESLLDRIECVVVSPLMRALETAVGSLGGEHVSADGSAAESTDVTIDSVSKQRLMYVGSDSLEGIRPGHPPIAPRSTNHRAPLPFLACELCREHIGLNPCDRRRGTSYYRETFPGVDFSEIETETDELWGTMNETNGDMCQRAHRFMEWIMKRKEQHIAVVTHSAFMAAMLREFGATDQLGCAEQVQLETRRWPNNCEMRPMVVVDPSGGGGRWTPCSFQEGSWGLQTRKSWGGNQGE